jgi:8-oxo-dGTP diphosphatase
VKEICVVAAVIWRNGRILAAQRGPCTTRAGCWEFPGGTVEQNETEEACLAREIAEELCLEVTVCERLLSVSHDYPDVRVLLHAYRCECAPGEPALCVHQALRWLLPAELDQVTWSDADRPVVEMLRAETAQESPSLGVLGGARGGGKV